MGRDIHLGDMRVTINGEQRLVSAPLTIDRLLADMGLDPRKVAVERNLEIVSRSGYGEITVADGDRIEIVHFIGGGAPDVPPPNGTGADAAADDALVIAGKPYLSRLLVGTGKYRDFEETARAIEASGAEIVTVAVRRVNVTDRGKPMLVDYVDPKTYTYLPNTAGCYTATDAVRTLRLAREAGGWDLVKLEVLGDQQTLCPHMAETLTAAETLVAEGFKVMVYCTDDLIFAKRLEEMGCVAIMPLAAPIGSGLGIQNAINIRLIVERAKVPVLVDAGVGTASDAAVAMELGCDGVLMNTAIAEAKDPILMARAMRLAVQSGRLAYRAGRMAKKRYADPSSPLAGLI
jgi:thiazole synthase